MRATDFLDVPVFDMAGNQLGVVVDFECEQDRPVSGRQAHPRVRALVLVTAARQRVTLDWDSVEIDLAAGVLIQRRPARSGRGR